MSKTKSQDSDVCSRSRWKPMCHCGDMAVLQRVTTVKNMGKRFWGCPNYKGGMQTGCGFFDWFYVEVGDENEQFWMHRLGVVTEGIAEAKKDIEKATMENEELGKKLMKLESEMKNIMKWKKILNLMFVMIIIVLVVMGS
ncbi:unnamed protein product [Lathyrus sativus]|nr:unnamed protein product [Lathyrus sativus]